MKSAVSNVERYDNLDGLRSYAAVGIVLMHVLVNGHYEAQGFIFERLIPSFTDFVFLFMVISSFSMCCGYYEKISKAEITPAEFYEKRFRKIAPFFYFLCALDFIISPSLSSLSEVFANMTLCFGLLPNANISVIGVGWFLGLIFVFYFMFPFFCYLIESKSRAWLSFVVALIFNYLCIERFDAGRSNIVYSAVYFFLGALIYVYRGELSRFAGKYSWVLFSGIVVSTAAYFLCEQHTIANLAWCSFVLIYALKPTMQKISLLNNSVARFLSKISMEIYLCHMVIFRALELFGLTHLLESDVWSYVITAAATISGAVIFSLIFQKMVEKLKRIRRDVEEKTWQKNLTAQ